MRSKFIVWVADGEIVSLYQDVGKRVLLKGC